MNRPPLWRNTNAHMQSYQEEQERQQNQILKQQQREAERQQRESERAQDEAAREAHKAEQTAREIGFKEQGLTTFTTADGVIHADPASAERNQRREEAAAQKEAKAEQTAANKQRALELDTKGIKHTPNPVTGRPMALQTEEQVAQMRRQQAEERRRKQIGEQVDAIQAEADLRKAEKPLLPRDRTTKRPAIETDDKQGLPALKKQLFNALTDRLSAAAAQKSGTDDYIPFNERSTPEAEQAAQRLARLQQQPEDLTDEDLQQLAADDSTKPVVEQYRQMQQRIAEDDEEKKFHDEQNTRIKALRLKATAPEKYAAWQRSRRAAMTPEQLAADLEVESADLEQRRQDIEARAGQMQVAIEAHTTKLDQLSAEAAQRRSAGIAAGEVVTYQLPDGTTENWPKDLAEQREEINARLAETQMQQHDGRADLDVEVEAWNADRKLIEEGEALLNSQQQTQQAQALQQQAAAQQSARSRLRGSAGGEMLAKDFDQFLNEASTRRDELLQVYDGQPPEEAVAHLDEDLDQQFQGIEARHAQRLTAAKAAVDALRDFDTEKDGIGKTGNEVQAHKLALAQGLADSLDISTEEAHNLIDDTEKADWTPRTTSQGAVKDTIKGIVEGGQQIIGEAADSLGMTPYLKVDSKMALVEEAKKLLLPPQDEKTRILSNGTIIVNPDISDEREYRKAIEASAGTPEAKKAALERYPELRQQAAKQVLESIREIQNIYGDSAISDWTEHNKKRPANVSEEEWAMQLVEKNKAESRNGLLNWMGSVSREAWVSLNQGALDLRQQASGLLGGAIGNLLPFASEALMGDAEWAGRKADALQKAKELSGDQSTGFLQAGLFSQTPRLAASLIPAGIGARGAAKALSLFAKTKLGSRLFPAVAAQISKAATPIQAAKAAQALSRTALGGAAVAGGAQTYGAQLSDIYSSLRREHSDLSHVEALRMAQAPALLSGAATVALTSLMGGGTEKLFTDPAGIRSLFKKQFATRMQKAGYLGAAAASGFVREWGEEISDELFSTVQAAIGKGHSVQEAVAAFMEQLPELSVAVGLLGAGGELKAANDRSVVAPASARPESIAAAEAAIQNHRALVNGVEDPQETNNQQLRAALALATAQGGDLLDATEQQLNAAGWTRRDSGGREMPPGKFARLKGYAGPNVLNIDTEGNATVDPEYVKSLHEHPTLQPVARAIPETATVRKPAEGQKPASGTRPDANQPAVQNPAKQGTQPPRSGSSAAPAGTAVSSTDPTAVPDDKQAIATFLTERGMPADEAAKAAEDILAHPDMAGKGFDYYFKEPIKRTAIHSALGITGSQNSKDAADNPLRYTGKVAQVKAEMERKAAEAKAKAEQKATKLPDYLQAAIDDAIPGTPSKEVVDATKKALAAKEISDIEAARIIAQQTGSADHAALKNALVQKLGWSDNRAGAAAALHVGDKSKSDVQLATGQRATEDPADSSKARLGPEPEFAKAPSSLRQNTAYANHKTLALSRIKDPAKKAWARQFFDLFEKSFERHHLLYDALAVGPAAARYLDGGMTAVFDVGGKITRFIDLDAMVAQFDYLANPAAAVKATGIEEDIHAQVLQLARENPSKYGRKALIAQWQALPATLKQRVWSAYRATNQNAKNADSVEMPKLTETQQWHLHNEFLRMLVQDKHFAGDITETVDPTGGLLQWVKDLLGDLGRILRNLLSKAPKDLQQTIQTTVDEIAARLKLIEGLSSTSTARLETLPTFADSERVAQQAFRQLVKQGNGTFKPEALTAIWDQLDPSLQQVIYKLRSREPETGRFGKQKQAKVSKAELMQDLLAVITSTPTLAEQVRRLLVTYPPTNRTPSLLQRLTAKLSAATQPSLIDALSEQTGTARADLAALHSATLRLLGDFHAIQFVQQVQAQPEAQEHLQSKPNTAPVTPAQSRSRRWLLNVQNQRFGSTPATKLEITEAPRPPATSRSTVNEQAVDEMIDTLRSRARRIADIEAAFEKTEREIERLHREAADDEGQTKLRAKYRLAEIAANRARFFLEDNAARELEQARQQGRGDLEKVSAALALARGLIGQRRGAGAWRSIGWTERRRLALLGIGVDQNDSESWGGYPYTLSRLKAAELRVEFTLEGTDEHTLALEELEWMKTQPAEFQTDLDETNAAYVERGFIFLKQSTLNDIALSYPHSAALISPELTARQRQGMSLNQRSPESKSDAEETAKEKSQKPAAVEGNPEETTGKPLTGDETTIPDTDPDFAPLPDDQSPFASTPETEPETTETPEQDLNFDIPLSKRGRVRSARFPNAASLEAFQFKLDVDTKELTRSTPKEKAAAEQRGITLLARLMKETSYGQAKLEEKLLTYHEQVVAAAESASAFGLFTPPPFIAHTEINRSTEILPAPEGGDVITGLTLHGIYRIGPVTDGDGWAWYHELKKDAALSKLKNAEAQRLARKGDITDPKAKLAYLNDNIVGVTYGRSIDEAVDELKDSTTQKYPYTSGEELGRAILDALDERVRAAATPDPAAQEEKRNLEASTDFDTYAAGVEGQPFTGQQLATELEPEDEIQIGSEYLVVIDTDPTTGEVSLESSRFGNVTIKPDQQVKLADGPNHLRIPKIVAQRAASEPPASRSATAKPAATSPAPATLPEVGGATEAIRKANEELLKALIEEGLMAAHRKPSAALKKWFGNSKVTNPDGTPKVVYHGTFQDFSEFTPQPSSLEGGIDRPFAGWFFTDSTATATGYAYSADPSSYEPGGYLHDSIPEGSSILPVYLALQQPLIVDAKGSSWDAVPHAGREWVINDLAVQAKKDGHDGLIVKNVFDSVSDDAGLTTTYVAFKPEQVKGIFNNGKWDPKNPQILGASDRILKLAVNAADAHADAGLRNFPAFASAFAKAMPPAAVIATRNYLDGAWNATARERNLPRIGPDEAERILDRIIASQSGPKIERRFGEPPPYLAKAQFTAADIGVVDDAPDDAEDSSYDDNTTDGFNLTNEKSSRDRIAQYGATNEQRQQAIADTYGPLSPNIKVVRGNSGKWFISRGRGLLLDIDGDIHVATPQVALPSVGETPAPGKRFFALAGDKSNWVGHITKAIDRAFPNLDEETDFYIEPYGGGLVYLQNLPFLQTTQKPVLINVSSQFEPKRLAIYRALKAGDPATIDDIRKTLTDRNHAPATTEARYLVSLMFADKKRVANKATENAAAQLDTLAKLLQRPNVSILPNADDAVFEFATKKALLGKRITFLEDSNYPDLPHETTDTQYRDDIDTTPGLPGIGPKASEVVTKVRGKDAALLLEQKLPAYRAILDAGGTIIGTNNMAPPLLNGLLAEFADDGHWLAYMHQSRPVADDVFRHPDGKPVLWTSYRPEYLALLRKGVVTGTPKYADHTPDGLDYRRSQRRSLAQLGEDSRDYRARNPDQRGSRGDAQLAAGPAQDGQNPSDDREGLSRGRPDDQAKRPLTPAIDKTLERAPGQAENALEAARTARDLDDDIRASREAEAALEASLPENLREDSTADIEAELLEEAERMLGDYDPDEDGLQAADRSSPTHTHAPARTQGLQLQPINREQRNALHDLDEQQILEAIRTNDPLRHHMVIGYWNTVGFTEIANNLYPAITQTFRAAVMRMPVTALPGKTIHRFQGYATAAERDAYLQNYKPGAVSTIRRPANAFSIDTMMGKELAESFGGEHMVQFSIRSPKAVRDFASIYTGDSPGMEVLYAQGSQFTIASIEQVANPTNWSGRPLTDGSITQVILEEASVPRLTDALFASPRRAREAMRFDPPFHTSFGDIISYEWMSQPVGGLESQRISNWDAARINPATGREIVHHFKVQKPDGIHTVSLETAIGQLTKQQRDQIRARIRTEQDRRRDAANGQLSLFASNRRVVHVEPGFYSALAEAIRAKMPARATPAQILGILKNAGLKEEEMKWTGIRQWLQSQAQDGPITQDQVLAYLATEGSVKFTVTRLNNINADEDAEQSRLHERYRELTDQMADLRRQREEGILTPSEASREMSRISAERSTLDDRLNDLKRRIQSDQTRNTQWTLHGGTNPQEVVTTWKQPRTENSEPRTNSPNTDSDTTHYGDLDALAWYRTTDRITSDGLSILFGEEFQSKWHKLGREEGYKPTQEEIEAQMRVMNQKRDAFLAAEKAFNEARDASRRAEYAIESWESPDGNRRAKAPQDLLDAADDATRRRAEAERTLNQAREAYAATPAVPSGTIPDAPYRASWPLMLFKRFFRDAVLAGKDAIGWTTGDTQADRYDLSKQVKRIDAKKFDQTRYEIAVLDKNDNEVKLPKEAFTAEELPEIVGKELAERIVSDLRFASPSRVVNYTGLDLRVGGQGMRRFYDDILVKEFGKYVKPWGGTVERSSIGNGKPDKPAYTTEDATSSGDGWRVKNKDGAVVRSGFANEQSAQDWIKTKRGYQATPIHLIRITPQMRESVLAGQALFAAGRTPITTGSRDVASLRTAKDQWTAHGYPEAEAEAIVDRFYKPQAFEGIPANAVLLPMPSTTGRNILPYVLAERIAADRGSTVVNTHVAIPTAKLEAKKKTGFWAKVEDPVTYQPGPDFDTLKKLPGPLYLTEDVHNTGESWMAMRSLLEAHGIPVAGIATLTATDLRATNPRDIERLAGKIAEQTSTPLAEVQPLVHGMFHDSYKQWFNKAERVVTGNPGQARRLLDAARALPRSSQAQPADAPAAVPAPQGQGNQDASLSTALAAYFDDPKTPLAAAKRTPAKAAARDLAQHSSDPYRIAARQRWDALLNRDANQLREAFAASDTISNLLHQHITTGHTFDIRGAIIETPQQFAAFNLAVRSPYFESTKIAVLDGANQVIHSEILAVGTLNSTVVDPRRIAGIIQNAPGKAAGFLIAHNHPSGNPAPSPADASITLILKRVGDALGVPLVDHVITNGERYFSFREHGSISEAYIPDQIDQRPSRTLKPKLPILPTPPAPAPGSVAPFEVYPTGGDRSIPFDSKKAASNYIKALRTADPDHAHIIYLNTQSMVTGVERIPITDAPTMAKRILQGASREGAYFYLLSLPGLGGPTTQQRSLHMRIATVVDNDAGVTLADTMISHPTGAWSFKEHGLAAASRSVVVNLLGPLADQAAAAAREHSTFTDGATGNGPYLPANVESAVLAQLPEGFDKESWNAELLVADIRNRELTSFRVTQRTGLASSQRNPVASTLELAYAPADGQTNPSTEAGSETRAITNPLDPEASVRAGRAQRIPSAAKDMLPWASQQGWLLAPGAVPERLLLSRNIPGGEEHSVFFDEQTQRAIKITKDKDGQPHFVAGGPSAYLVNLHKQNEIFDTAFAFEGVVDDNGIPRFVITQPWTKGTASTEEARDAYFKDQRFDKLGEGMYYSTSRDLLVTDATALNVLQDENGNVKVIDVQVREVNPRQAERYENMIAAREKGLLAADRTYSNAIEVTGLQPAIKVKGRTYTGHRGMWHPEIIGHYVWRNIFTAQQRRDDPAPHFKASKFALEEWMDDPGSGFDDFGFVDLRTGDFVDREEAYRRLVARGIPIPPDTYTARYQSLDSAEILNIASALSAAPRLATQVAQAAQQTDPNPTQAQKQAGNYAKGKTSWNGLRLSIENPRGTERSGRDRTGREWSVTMPHHYGYFLGTEGKDGDHVDFFMGPNPDSQQVVVINQRKVPDGPFDEHKVMLGFDKPIEAARGYLAAYEPGWKGLQSTVVTTVAGLKHWLNTADTTKPATKDQFKNDGDVTETSRETPAVTASDALPAAPRRAAWDKVPGKGDPESLQTGYISGKHSDTIADRALQRGDIGLLITPLIPSYLAHTARYPFVAIDNGVFSKATPFNPEAFRALVDNVAAKPDVKAKTLFVVAPDVVGDAQRTLDQFAEWADYIHSRGLPVALAAQDGLEDIAQRIPWQDIDVLFVGGSTEWKTGQIPQAKRQAWANLFMQAHQRGIPVHMGRVNTNDRIAGIAQTVGASTVDGTYLAFGPDKNLPKLERMLDQLNVHGNDLGAQQFPELGRAPSINELYDLALDESIIAPDQLGAYEPATKDINALRLSLGLPTLNGKRDHQLELALFSAPRALQKANLFRLASDDSVLKNTRSEYDPINPAKPLILHRIENNPEKPLTLPREGFTSNGRSLFGHFFTLDPVNPANVRAGSRIDVYQAEGLKLFDWDQYGTGDWNKFSTLASNKEQSQRQISAVKEQKQMLLNRGYHGILVHERGFGFTVVVFPESIDTPSSLPAAPRALRKIGDAVAAGTHAVAKVASSAVAATGLEKPLSDFGSNRVDKRIAAALDRVAGPKVRTAEQAARAWLDQTEGIAPKVRGIVDELLPDVLLPREWLALKNEYSRKSSLGSETANDLIRALSGNPRLSDLAYPPEFAQNPEHRVKLFRAMEGEIPMSDLPPAMQRLAGRLRQLLRDTGEELVRQGLMNPDTFEELQANGWMPRYTETEASAAGGSFLAAFKLGVRDLLQQRSTAYHIVDTTQRDRTGQFVTVTRDEGGRRNRWRFRDAASRDAYYSRFIREQTVKKLQDGGKDVNDYLAALTKKQRGEIRDQIRALTLDAVEKPETLSITLRKIIRAELENQKARFAKKDPFEPEKLIRDPVYAVARYVLGQTHNAATMELLRSTAANAEWVSDIAVNGFEKIPDQTRFGPLAGKFVRTDVARQVLELVDVPNAALQLYDSVLRKWKGGKLVWNPGSHIRDAVGNTVFAYIAGNSLWNPGNWHHYRDAIDALRNGGAVYQELIERQVLGGDAYSGLVKQRLKGLLPDLATVQDYDPGRLMRTLMGMGSTAHGTHEFLSTLRRLPDDLYKTAAYLRYKEQGMSQEAAAAEVRKWFPYYDRLAQSSTTRAWGRFANPFFAFFRESTRIAATAAVERPLALAASLSLPAALSALSAILLGLDDRDRDEIEKDLAGRGKLLLNGVHPFSILLPVRSASGQVQQWDISAVQPFADIIGQRVVPLAEKENSFQTLWRQTLSAGPVLGLAYSWASGRDTFSGRHLTEPDMTTGEMVGSYAQHAFGVLAPPLAPDLLSAVGIGEGGALSKLGDRQANKTLQSYDPAQTILRTLFGFNVKSAEPNLYRQADDFRKSLGLEVTTGYDYGTTATSRVKRALVRELAQDQPNLEAIANLKRRLKTFGVPVETDGDIEKIVSVIDPAALIGGSRKLDITAEDARERFRRSLPPGSQRLYQTALSEYARILRRAPALIRQAR